MNNKMTALVSCFARYYHTKNSNIKIYNDIYAGKILNQFEIDNISKNMENGINFFNPEYKGDNPLLWIINNNLAPSVLARSRFNENYLFNEINLGLKQYVILGSGYDTSVFKVNDKLNIFELDKTEMIVDKINRAKMSRLNTNNITYIKTDFNNDWINHLLQTNFNDTKKTLCSLLGISYYLDKQVFENTIKVLSNTIPKGSIIIFDYPNDKASEKELLNQKLAAGANEPMKSTYSYKEIEIMAERYNMIICEHLNYEDVNKLYFYDYNTLNPNNKIIAPIGVSYCAIIKQ